MSQKLYCLISLILVMSMAGSVSAQQEVTWSNDSGTGDRLWDTPLNWNVGVPLAEDTTIIEGLYSDGDNGPIIQDGINAVCDYLEMGYYSSPPNEAVLTMTGGTLTVGGWIDPGGYAPGFYRFDVSGGNINVTGYGDGSWEGLYLGYSAGADTVMNITGGDIDIFGQVWMGWADTSRATINMSDGALRASVGIEIGSDSATQAVFNLTGGDVTADQWFSVGVWHDLGGNGHLNLHGGTIDTGNFRMGPVSQMDIGGGVLTCDTDLTVSNGFLFDPDNDTPSGTQGVYTGTVPTLVERGRITAYGVNQGQIVTDDVNYPAEAGLRALVKVDYDKANPGKTTVWAAAVDPNLAYNPVPFDMARRVQPAEFSSISFSAGTNAVQHDVYFGTDETALEFKGRQAATTYNPDINLFDFSTDYFWRIDEVNAAGGVQWPGDVWEFTTDDHIIVDEFDSYADNDALRLVWLDYWNIDTKAEVFVNTDPNFAYQGNSMRFNYLNDASPGDKRKYSEIEAAASDLQAGTDWTLGESKALVVYFRGTATNSAQPLYVALEDTSANVAVATYDDANGTQEEFWHQWNIDLEDFNGTVDLSSLSKVYLGVGVRGEIIPPAGIGGGTGDVYFDSFELWPVRCRPELVLTDFTGDCTTDGYDLDVIAAEWLNSDGLVVSAPPTYDPDVWLELDEGTGQVTTNIGLMGTDYNGQLGNTPDVDPCDPAWITNDPAADRLKCLEFDGTNDFVQIPELNLNSNTVTIAAWIKLNGSQTPWSGIVISREGTSPEGLNFGNADELRYSWNNDGTWEFDSGLIVPDGLWTFVALVIEPTQATIYMSDGTTYSSATNDTAQIVQTLDGIMAVGRDWDGRNFAGRIDDVRIYNTSLGLGEILGLAGISATLYDPLTAASNIVPRVPDPAVDPNYYPENPDIIDFRDYAAFGDGWLETVLWP